MGEGGPHHKQPEVDAVGPSFFRSLGWRATMTLEREHYIGEEITRALQLISEEADDWDLGMRHPSEVDYDVELRGDYIHVTVNEGDTDEQSGRWMDGDSRVATRTNETINALLRWFENDDAPHISKGNIRDAVEQVADVHTDKAIKRYVRNVTEHGPFEKDGDLYRPQTDAE